MTTLTLPLAPATRIAPLGRREITQWLAPAPLWDGLDVGAGASGLTTPFIAELTTDRFVDAFTGMLAGTGGASPADLAAMEPAEPGDRTGQSYIRFTVADRPGVLAEITAAMRDAEVSIESLIQQGLAFRSLAGDDQLPFVGQERQRPDQRGEVLDLAQAGQRTGPELALALDQARQHVRPRLFRIGTGPDAVGDAPHAGARLVPFLERDPLQRV